MKLLSLEHTLLVTGGVGRTSSTPDKGRLAIQSTVQETLSSESCAADDLGRSLPAALVIVAADEASSGLIHTQRFVRFDANRLAPGEPDVDDFNGFNDQGLSV